VIGPVLIGVCLAVLAGAAVWGLAVLAGAAVWDLAGFLIKVDVPVVVPWMYVLGGGGVLIGEGIPVLLDAGTQADLAVMLLAAVLMVHGDCRLGRYRCTR
jgi:hypothetical protein